MSRVKVLITTSGVGSRLGKLTERTNKSLIKVGEKPAIAHIIESYPSDTEFVVTLGHYGEHVREFLEIAYPSKQFVFVNVEKYVGKGSSLAYSIYHARAHLQAPFIFHASDTIVPNLQIPDNPSNWVVGKRGVIGTNYASFDIKGRSVAKFNQKGMLDSDYAYVGIVGIHAYDVFWDCVESILSPLNREDSPSDLNILVEMLKKGENFQVQEVEVWHDTGNTESLQSARDSYQDNETILEKTTESVYFIDASVIKFSVDSELNRKKVKRAKILGNTIPPLVSSSNYFFKYDYVEGELLSKSRNSEIILQLLDWSWENLWNLLDKSPSQEFRRDCQNFYLGKSFNRIETFCESRQLRDVLEVINGKEVLSARNLLSQAKKTLLEDVVESNFHGDFILDNIINTSNGFKLIDWRHEFGESLTRGDIYYDLAKLNHSFHMSHRLINKNLFEITFLRDQVQCSILRTDVGVEMAHKLQDFVSQKDLSWNKVKVLTPIIWLNMAPLHHHPFDQFLFYYGRLKLSDALKEDVLS